MNFRPTAFAAAATLCAVAGGCASNASDGQVAKSAASTVLASAPDAQLTLPGQVIDLSHWNMTIPVDENHDSKPDQVKIPRISKFHHPDFFYVNEAGHVVFASPNQAATTANSSNTRSELRQMLRGSDKSVKTKSPGNNFSIQANPESSQFAAVGGRLEATLRVNHVSLNAGHPEKAPAYSAVVGQIHGVKESGAAPDSKFGFGNEPLKIFFKKFPHHQTGSVFWTYERNLAKADPDRRDIAYPVWGNTWDVATDPGSEGIALDEEFSYVVNVYENVMHLTFSSDAKGVVRYRIDLSNNVDAHGQVDDKDNPEGYSGDQLYFKAGIYNQCSTRDKEGFWYAACPGTGEWSVDEAAGNYAQSTFSKLVQGPAQPPN